MAVVIILVLIGLVVWWSSSSSTGTTTYNPSGATNSGGATSTGTGGTGGGTGSGGATSTGTGGTTNSGGATSGATGSGGTSGTTGTSTGTNNTTTTPTTNTTNITPGTPMTSGSGYPIGYDQLSQDKQRIVMSGFGTVGTPPAWPRPNIYTDTSSGAGMNQLGSAIAYATIPGKYTKLSSVADIRGCDAVCQSSGGKCVGGKYYFADNTPSAGYCYGAPS